MESQTEPAQQAVFLEMEASESTLVKRNFSSVPGSAFSTPSRSEVSGDDDEGDALAAAQYFSFSPITATESLTLSTASPPADAAQEEETNNKPQAPAMPTAETISMPVSLSPVATTPSPAPVQKHGVPLDETPRASNQKTMDWPSNVETMASSVNLAFNRIKNFASPYLKERAPDLVDTSTESVSPEIDAKELVQELRPSGATPKRPSPKSTPSRARPSPARNTGRKPSPKSTSDQDATNLTIPPMMRMRNPTVQEAVTAAEQTTPQRLQKEEDFMAAKQRKWKQKIRQVERKKEKERRVLNGKSSRRRKRRHRRRDKEAMPGCQDGLLNLIDSFASVRCGSMADAVDAMDELLGESTDSSSEDSLDSGSDGISQQVSMESTLTSVKTGMTASPARPKQKEIVSKKDSKRDSKPTTKKVELPYEPASRPMSPPMSPKQVESLLHDRNFIRNFITTARDGGIDFIIHKKSRQKAMPQPMRAKAYLRDGEPNSNGQFSGPWLVWETEGSSSLNGVDLFDIRSLDKATALQLEQYPLAIPGHSLFLRVNGGSDYVFEMKDWTAALQFVHGMRWVVARLSFNLIIGNAHVSCEMLEMHAGVRSKSSLPTTPLEEAHWSRAMNDLTNHLVDKSTISIK